MQQKIT